MFVKLTRKKFILWIVLILLIASTARSLTAYAFLNYAHVQQIQGNDAASLLQASFAVQPNDYYIRWAIARRALVDGQAHSAADLLKPLTKYAKDNPLLLLDILHSLIESGQSDKAISIYDSSKSISQSNVFSDTIALAYLEQAKYADATIWRPNDLYANYHLWQYAQAINDENQVSSLKQKLTYFAPDSVNPRDEHLIKYIGQAAVALFENKIWNLDTVKRVMAFLVWQYYKSPTIETMLVDLNMQLPQSMVWQNLLKEAKQRRAINSSNFAFNSPQWNKGSTNKNLVQSTYLNTLNPSINPQAAYWSWNAWYGKTFSEARFFAGIDPHETASALRLMNLWQRPLELGDPPPYSEYISQEITLEPNTDYTLSVQYKTDSEGEVVAFVALLEYTAAPQFTFTHIALPDTAGSWQTWQTTGQSYTEPIKVRLLLRMLGTGSVWFDNVQLVKGNLK